MFHEFGHFIIAKIFNWNIDKIYIYPLGGITKFNEKINKPFIEELLVTIAGPIFQIIMAKYLINIEKDVMIFNKYLLLFNLLPIVPLDGGRLLKLITSKLTPFKKSLKATIIISYLTYFIGIIIVIKIKSFFFLLVFITLILKIKEEHNNTNFEYNRFLIERAFHFFNFKKVKVINKIDDMYKYRKNIFKINDRLYTEKELFKCKDFHKYCK